MKIKFGRLKAARGFASVAEDMVEVQQRSGEKFWDADQLANIAQTIRDNLQEENGTYFVVLPKAALETVKQIQENCCCQTGYRSFNEDDDDADECYINDCELK